MPEAPTNPLFSEQDLTDLLGDGVTAASAAIAEHVVWGWLQPLLNLVERPAAPSAQQFSWAIQLGAIAHENPAGLSAKQVGNVKEEYSAEARDAILADVAASVPGGSPATRRPRGKFPKARRYPDPAEC